MKTLKSFTIPLFLIVQCTVFAENYYVSHSGSDSNSGTLENPLATVQKAHDTARKGDVIYLRGGLYKPTSQTKFKGEGSENAYIVLRSYPGEIPVIDGENIPDGTTTWSFSGAKYWKIMGPIILTNGRGAGIVIGDSRFLEFDQVESCYNGKQVPNGAHGFMLWSGSDIVFKNCDAHHNANHLWKSTKIQELNQYQHGDGWRIFSGSNVRLEGCRSWHNLDDNYDFLGTEEPIEMIDCWAAYAGRDDSHGSITGIPNNEMPDVDGRGLLWGNGIKLGYNEDYTNHKVIRCTSWNNNAAGFHMSYGPLTIINCASYENKAFGFDYTDGNKHEMFNCWEFENNSENPNYPETDPDLSLSSHNSWDGTISVALDHADFLSVDDSGLLDERSAEGTLPKTSFLKLSAGSDLIDAGIDMGFPFLGVAPDIGAFEFEDGSTSRLAEKNALRPDQFSLINYPNPFNPVTQICFNLLQAGHVDISVFNVFGGKVIQLDSEYRQAGLHALSWNASDADGRRVASGSYLLCVKTGNVIKTIKMTYIQ